MFRRNYTWLLNDFLTMAQASDYEMRHGSNLLELRKIIKIDKMSGTSEQTTTIPWRKNKI